MLQSHSWPGNVRELENMISTGNRACRREHDSRGRIYRKTCKSKAWTTVTRRCRLDRLSGRFTTSRSGLLPEAIREKHGNKTLAARSLCISRAYLHRLVRLAEPGGAFEADGQEMVAE